MNSMYGSIEKDHGNYDVLDSNGVPIESNIEGVEKNKSAQDNVDEAVCFKRIKRNVSTWWLRDSLENDNEARFDFAAHVESKKETNLFWVLMGFEENPLVSNVKSGHHVRNNSAADLRLSMLSNFSTAYNIVSISLALDMMSNFYESISASDRSLCSSALLAGMIFGQLAGGTIGDLLGRHVAMTIVMFLQIMASFSSAFSSNTQDIEIPFLGLYVKGFSIFKVLACWRFVLGVGCGGVYPLAATITAESSSAKENRGKLVALTFSMQGVGYFTVPLLAYILVSLLGDNSDMTWRLLLGSGSLPGIILTYNRFLQRRRHKSTDLEKKEAQSTPQHKNVKKIEPIMQSVSNKQNLKSSIIEAISTEENLIQKLLGTSGCWFFFDVLFYGNTLFQPVVLSAAFGASETVLKTARDTCIIAALSLPGYFVSIASIGRQSPKYIQMQGFMLMAILYFIIGFWFEDLAKMKTVLLTFYGSTFFFSNYGPNATTFMLPSMTFSKPCRSTLNGISAASGKAGALLGAILFEPAAVELGNNTVMIICALISLLSFFLTFIYVSDTVGLGSTELDKERDKNAQSIGAGGTPDELITLESGYLTEDFSFGYVTEVNINQDSMTGAHGKGMKRIKSAPSFLDL